MLSGLNQRQLQAAIQIHGAVLVVAGAGTGKTRVITMRIAHMVRHGILPENIVGLSFTNKASHEMRERLTSLLGRRLASRVTLSTFHSYALSLLRHFSTYAGLNPQFSVCGEKDAHEMLREAVLEAKVSEFFSVNYFKERISQLKDELCTPEEVARRPSFVDASLVAAVYAGYQRRLRLHDLVDFDDLVFLCCRLFREHEAIRDQMRAQHTHFLVDEYQDTSAGQFELLQHLVPSSGGNICAVGDDDQSIYGWRGARPGILRLFLESFEGAQRVTLEQNYRCSPAILQAANSVIDVNPDRLRKQLWSDRQDSQMIRIFRADGEDEEASYVAQYVATLVAAGVPPEQCAVLFRASGIARHVSAALALHGLSVRAPQASSLLDRPEVRDVIALLASAAHPHCTRSRIRALRVLGYEFSLDEQERLATSSAQQNWPGQDVWTTVTSRLGSAQSGQAVSEVLTNWFEESSMRKRLRSEASSMERALAREETVRRFLSYLAKMEGEGSPSEGGEYSLVGAILDRLLMRDWNTGDENTQGRVQLLTIHAAKGLEFDHVFVIGLEEGVLPHEKSLESGSEQEERRLMYVAMTRARQALHLTSAATRSSGDARGVGRRVSTRPSRYLEQIPASLVQDVSGTVLHVDDRRREAARRLFERFR